MSEIHKIFCTNCGAQIEVDLDEFDSDTIFCIECGKETDISDFRKQQEEAENEYSDEAFYEEAEEAEECPKEELSANEEASFLSDNSDEYETVSPFKPVDYDKEDVKETVYIKEQTASKSSSSNPFESISENEKEMIESRISSRVKVWHEAIKTSSDNVSEFTDKFAHGMPDWDLTPPDMLIRRKAAKPTENKR